MLCPLSNSNLTNAVSLCLKCGLCCNGVLFADVRLQPQDNAAALATTLPLIKTSKSVANKGTPLRFLQPCCALGTDGRCSIYADRPTYCRQFECLLFKKIVKGQVAMATAQRLVRSARNRAEKVRRLLRALGDDRESLPLSRRFRDTTKRVLSTDLDEATAETYGELTLATHDLNCLLSSSFYPGSLD
jgi:uncharacterized protein